eukprot:403332647
MNSYGEDPSQRANTTNEQSIYKTIGHNNRNDLNTASMMGGYKNRDAMSTRGGMSFGSRMDINTNFEPPFLVLPDQETLSHFMTKQRKMVSSVSSKYLNYNAGGGHSKILGDGLSTKTGDRDSPNKIGNFNEYQHVYNDHKSNEANVNWITKLRESDSVSNLMSSTRLTAGDNDKQSIMHDSSPPSVYYKGNSDQIVKRVADYEYKGNHLDVVHLTKHRIGATPNIGQVTFETGLRKYMSQKDLHQSNSKDNQVNRTNLDKTNNQNQAKKKSPENSLERDQKDFVTIFPKSKSILQSYAPTFLPPISNQARKQLDQLEVIVEKTRTIVKGLHKKPDSLQMISSFDGFHKSMPKFTDKVEDANNYNQIRHLMNNGKKMSGVLWELSLRHDAYKKNEHDEDNRRKFTAASKNPQAAFDGLQSSISNKKNIQYFSQPRRKVKDQMIQEEKTE